MGRPTVSQKNSSSSAIGRNISFWPNEKSWFATAVSCIDYGHALVTENSSIPSPHHRNKTADYSEHRNCEA